MTVPAVRRAKEKQLCYLVNLLEPTLTARWIIIFISLLRIYCFHILNPLVVSYSFINGYKNEVHADAHCSKGCCPAIN